MVPLDLDPNVVKPGWTPLLIVIGLGIVVALLFVSMRRQFRRIDVSRSQPGVLDAAAEGPDAPPAGRSGDDAPAAGSRTSTDRPL